MKGRGSQFRTHLKTHLYSGIAWSRGGFSAFTNKAGYTIVEVMVFLAITTALFVMIAGTFSGRQASTEFSVGARDIESQLRDIANDVTTGYYTNPGNFTCNVPLGVPTISSGSNAQGTNNNCIFIGRVAQFDLSGVSGKQLNIYSVVGARQASGHDVINFNEAKPRALANPVSPVDLTETAQIPPGLVVRSMYAQYASSRIRIRAVGFFSTFDPGAAADPTSLSVNIIPLGISPSGNAKADVVSAISTIDDNYFSLLGNPPGGIQICFDGDRTDQHALLTLGGNNRRLTSDVTIERDSCASAGYPA